MYNINIHTLNKIIIRMTAIVNPKQSFPNIQR